MSEQIELNNLGLKEVSVRLILKEESVLYSGDPLDSPYRAAHLIQNMLRDWDRECVVVINLDNKAMPINYNIVSIGALDQSVAPITNIFKSALLSNAASIIMMHNHPSGVLNPSKEDLDLTKRSVEAGKLFGIELLDHLLVGPKEADYYSIFEHSPELINHGPIDFSVIEAIMTGRSVKEMGVGYVSEHIPPIRFFAAEHLDNIQSGGYFEAPSLDAAFKIHEQFSTPDKNVGFILNDDSFWSGCRIPFMKNGQFNKEEINCYPHFRDNAFVQNAVKRFESLLGESQLKVHVYQLKRGDENHFLRFASSSELKEMGKTIDINNYDLVYTGPMKEGEALDDIYGRFNIDKPDDFKGHSLSVSDVIVVQNGTELYPYYVDSFGFLPVNDFFSQPQRETLAKKLSLDEKIAQAKERTAGYKAKPAQERGPEL